MFVEDEDFIAALAPEGERSKMVRFLYAHVLHKLVQSDDPNPSTSY